MLPRGGTKNALVHPWTRKLMYTFGDFSLKISIHNSQMNNNQFLDGKHKYLNSFCFVEDFKVTSSAEVFISRN